MDSILCSSAKVILYRSALYSMQRIKVFLGMDAYPMADVPPHTPCPLHPKNPQSLVHEDAGTFVASLAQIQPASTEQVEEQPACPRVLPTSQPSFPSSTPSPHTGAQDDAVVVLPPEHDQPDSTCNVTE
jgi:hypothetical protein